MKTYICILMCLYSMQIWAQVLEPKADKKGRFGYFNLDGKEIISCSYQEAYPFVNGIAKVKKNNKYGLIDERGKAIGGIKYTVMENYAGTDFLLVAVGGSPAKPKDKIASRKDINPAYFKGSALFPIKGAKWGLVDKNGKIIVPIAFEEISNLTEGIAYVKKGGKYGLILENGKQLLPPSCKFIGAFNNQGVCWVKAGGSLINTANGQYVNGGKTGIINREGKFIVPLKYPYVGNFTENVGSSLEYNHAYKSNQDLQPFGKLPDSTSPYLWFSKLAGVYAGVVDKQGTIVIPINKFNIVYPPTDGMARIITKKKKVEKEGFYNIQTKQTVFPENNYIYFAFKHGVSKVQDKSENATLYYYVDKNLKPISAHYSFSSEFYEGLCTVKKDSYCGMIDTLMNTVIPFEYSDMKVSFHEETIGAKKDSKWGFINKKNEVVIPFDYSSVGNFKNQMTGVCRDNKWGCIDKSNHIILPIEWDDFLLSPTSNPSYFWVKKDGLYYKYNLKEKKIAFPKGYSEATYFVDGIAEVKAPTGYGIIDEKGAELIPCVFETKEDVQKAQAYLIKNGKKAFNKVDLARFNIYNKNTCNSYELSSTIPNEEWDY